jgi:hypothetical protein
MAPARRRPNSLHYALANKPAPAPVHERDRLAHFVATKKYSPAKVADLTRRAARRRFGA